MEAHALPAEKPFHGSMEKFLDLTSKLQTKVVNKMRLASLESLIETDGREMLRLLLEEHIQLRGPGSVGQSVEGSDGIDRSHRRERSLKLKSIFGEIKIERILYSKPGHTSLAPKEAMLNLPETSYSHTLQQRATLEIAKGSFDEAIASIKVQTGVRLPKRQVEEMAMLVSRDFDTYYQQRDVAGLRGITRENELLVHTTDGKGVAMRKEDLREATKKRADKEKKLKKRLSRGEKKNAKRMAQVASVYSIQRHERSAENIVLGSSEENPAPKPQEKRVWASLEHETADVIGHIFEEADRCDPKHKREWVVLVDGNRHQLDLIEKNIEGRRDWNEYWQFHEQCDYERNHWIHYAKPEMFDQGKLRLVK